MVTQTNNNRSLAFFQSHLRSLNRSLCTQLPHVSLCTSPLAHRAINTAEREERRQATAVPGEQDVPAMQRNKYASFLLDLLKKNLFTRWWKVGKWSGKGAKLVTIMWTETWTCYNMMPPCCQATLKKRDYWHLYSNAGHWHVLEPIITLLLLIKVNMHACWILL